MENENSVELAARLLLHEHLLEMLCADQFAGSGRAAAAVAGFRRDLLKRIQENPTGVAPVEGTKIADIVNQATAQAEVFMEKVGLRVAEKRF